MKTSDLSELVGLAALWGASFLFMRLGAAEFGPVALSAVRVAGAGRRKEPRARALSPPRLAEVSPGGVFRRCASERKREAPQSDDRGDVLLVAAEAIQKAERRPDDPLLACDGSER